MQKRVLPICLLGVVGLVTIVVWGCGTSNRQVTLRYKFESGVALSYDQTTKRTYKVTEGDSVVSRGVTDMSVHVDQLIRRILPDSTAEVQERDSWSYVGKGTKDSTVSDTTKETRELILFVKPNGKVVDIEFSSSVDSSSAIYIENFYQQGSPVFPDQPVTVGSKWTQTTPVVIDSQRTQASTTYELTGFGSRQGYECAMVEFNGNLIIPVKELPSDTTHRSGVDRIEISGALYFAIAEGLLVSQAEQWVVDGSRQKQVSGKTIKYSVALELSSVIALKERKKA